MDIITINNLTFEYANQKIYDNFSLSIKEGTFLTIAGSSGSGKSTLAKLLLGLLSGDGTIIVNQHYVNSEEIQDVRRSFGFVFENPDLGFVAETVLDEMVFTLENLCYPRHQIKKKVKEVSQYLQIEELLDKCPSQLSGGEKQIVSLASALMHDAKILLIDEGFSMIDPIYLEHIFRLLKKLNREKKITIINITHDLNQSLYGKELLILKKGKIVMYDKVENVLKEEKKLKSASLELPFMADLSNKLGYYHLVDKPIYDMDRMVNLLWK